jgi:CheY-like chemotaxis protein
MSMISEFAPHLPYLRRYARALTGSQASGDAYIRASLEALAASPATIKPSSSPRVSLYRFFHVIWGSTGAKLDHAGRKGSGALPADEKLQVLAPLHRQAFLLTALERFEPAEAAEILSVTPERLRELEKEALAEIETELSTRVLIIEDEPIIAADLEGILLDLGHTVAGKATTHREAVALAKAHSPGLVLCDVQLADGSSGIEAAAEILAAFDVPIIFITAFPERLLTGERPEPAYLISKPFQTRTVKAAIGQALFFQHPARPKEAA